MLLTKLLPGLTALSLAHLVFAAEESLYPRTDVTERHGGEGNEGQYTENTWWCDPKCRTTVIEKHTHTITKTCTETETKTHT